MIGAPIMITSPQKIEFLVHLPQILFNASIRVSPFREIQLKTVWYLNNWTTALSFGKSGPHPILINPNTSSIVYCKRNYLISNNTSSHQMLVLKN